MKGKRGQQDKLLKSVRSVKFHTLSHLTMKTSWKEEISENTKFRGGFGLVCKARKIGVKCFSEPHVS